MKSVLTDAPLKILFFLFQTSHAGEKAIKFYSLACHCKKALVFRLFITLLQVNDLLKEI